MSRHPVPCVSCGYELAGSTTHQCPECGADVRLAQARARLAVADAIGRVADGVLLMTVGVLAIAATVVWWEFWLHVVGPGNPFSGQFGGAGALLSLLLGECARYLFGVGEPLVAFGMWRSARALRACGAPQGRHAMTAFAVAAIMMVIPPQMAWVAIDYGLLLVGSYREAAIADGLVRVAYLALIAWYVWRIDRGPPVAGTVARASSDAGSPIRWTWVMAFLIAVGLTEFAMPRSDPSAFPTAYTYFPGASTLWDIGGAVLTVLADLVLAAALLVTVRRLREDRMQAITQALMPSSPHGSHEAEPAQA